MNEPKDRFITLNGLRLHYLEWGNLASPPMLLLHGGFAHAHWWQFVAEKLAYHYRMIGLDLRGHGDSEWADASSYGLEASAADVARLIEALDLRGVALVGHSFGGMIAIAATPAASERLSALIVIDTRARISPRTVRYMNALRILPRPIYPSLDEAVRRFRLLPEKHGARPEILAHVARHSVRPDGNGNWIVKSDRHATTGIGERDLCESIQGLELPLLLVRGGRSAVLPHTALAEIRAAVPHATVVEIPEAHHHVMLDNPEELADALQQFLVRCPT